VNKTDFKEPDGALSTEANGCGLEASLPTLHIVTGYPEECKEQIAVVTGFWTFSPSPIGGKGTSPLRAP